MRDWMLAHESGLRFGIFFGVLITMAVWELVAARRELCHSRPRRWFVNLGMAVLGALAVRLLFPAAAMGMALIAQREGWGLLNRWELHRLLSIGLSVVLLDFAIYLQHVMFHAVPALWRLHMVHHADRDFDVTTGIRFHPIEILLSVVVKFGVVVSLGTPPEAVLLFAVLLNTTAMFNHGNVRLPGGIDRWLRWIVVTPDMHRVHHSVVVEESNSNFGFNLPWWDRLMGTYRERPAAGHRGMRLGVQNLEEGEPRGLLAALSLPFGGSVGRTEPREPESSAH